MLFVVLFWIAVFLVVMRVLTWVAKRHPKARNAAGLIVEIGAAVAIAESLTAVAAVASGSPVPAALVVHAVFFALIGAAAHFFASNTAQSPLVVGLPFGLPGVAALVGTFSPPGRMFIGIVLVVLGGCLAWLKARSSRGPASSGKGSEATQA